jgi:hypothetical protein
MSRPYSKVVAWSETYLSERKHARRRNGRLVNWRERAQWNPSRNNPSIGYIPLPPP